MREEENNIKVFVQIFFRFSGNHIRNIHISRLLFQIQVKAFRCPTPSTKKLKKKIG